MSETHIQRNSGKAETEVISISKDDFNIKGNCLKRRLLKDCCYLSAGLGIGIYSDPRLGEGSGKLLDATI